MAQPVTAVQQSGPGAGEARSLSDMESLEFNKIAFAVLSTLLFVMGLGIFTDTIFASHPAAKPGYALPADEAGGSQGGAAAPAAAAVPLGELMAKADIKRGETTMSQCKACHTLDKGGKTGIGPNLYGVVDRPIAATEGFAYSPALQAKAKADGKWTFEHLQSFIANPRGYANGTKMAFAGLKDPARLADVLAYLRSLSDSPAPMPK